VEKYICQLLVDIAYVTENVSWPFVEKGGDLHDWIPSDEEERNAPVRDLEEWTGICSEQLPPAEMLSDSQVCRLLDVLKKMLDTFNWSFVLQTEVPERIQYAAIRDQFNQRAKVKRWHYGFFELCRPGTEHGKCALGEYCQCAFYNDFFAGYTDEESSPEEERARALEIEITYLKRKHGSDWMKYYPYHLDAAYDDDNGNPFDYGLGGDEEDEGDDWWKK
jgi:hypothetical protein